MNVNQNELYFPFPGAGHQVFYVLETHIMYFIRRC
jgi:hypothetical protein